MSLTLLTPPPPLIFSADLTSVRLLASGAFENGAKAVNTLSVSGNTATGVNFIFYYGSAPVLMTSASVPDSSGNQFLAGSGTPVPAADLLVYFKANARLNADFEITAVAGNVVFTAKNKGASYNCVPDTADVINTTVGASEVSQDNYTIAFKLYLENAENTGFDLIYKANLQLLPGKAEAMAYIGDKLHSAITKTIRQELPEQPTNAPLLCKKSCRKYYFDFAESYGNPIVVQPPVTSAIYTVIHGGLSSIGQFRNTCLELLAPAELNNDRFLRQGPKEFYTRAAQPQYLFFCNTRAARSVDLVFEFEFFDSETTYVNTIPGIAMDELRKYAFNVDFETAYAEPIDGQIVRCYKVYLKSGSDVVSETITYFLDYTFSQYLRYFLNWSSLGALDSRYTKGKGTTEIALSNKTGQRIAAMGENIQFGQSFTYDSKIKRSFSVATGWLQRKQLLANADFFLSNIKYRFSNSMLLPIVTPAGKIKEITDGENLYAQVFEYEYLFEDHAYTDGDAEDETLSIGIFGFNLGLSGSGTEIDPTVPSWVKAITRADIDRWNANNNVEVIPAPASAQIGGFFTLAWTPLLKAKYGDYGRFLVEMGNSYQPVPITITKDGDGKPLAYIFELSGINTLIHVL